MALHTPNKCWHELPCTVNEMVLRPQQWAYTTRVILRVDTALALMAVTGDPITQVHDQSSQGQCGCTGCCRICFR